MKECELPTARNMRSLLRQLNRDQDVAAWVQSFTTGKVGLVLSGGGGKGAYEIGCLRALRTMGISRYDAIAGTSVGALNAALIAQGDLNAAKTIWGSLRYKDVLKAHPIGFCLAFLLRLMLAPMFALTTRPSFMEAAIHYGSLRRLHFSRLIALRNAISPFASRVLAAVILSSAVLLAISLFKQELRWFWFEEIMKFSLYIIFAFGVLIVLWWTEYSIHNVVADKFALFSNAPLASLVKEKVNPDRLRAANVPVFVTVASTDWVPKPFESDMPARPLHSLMNYELLRIPIYTDLRTLSDDDLRLHVLQSAGLPEIFPRRIVGGKPVVDGGVVDNTPILPILAIKDPIVKKIVVVFLEKPSRVEQFLDDESARISALSNRLLRYRTPTDQTILGYFLQVAAVESGQVQITPTTFPEDPLTVPQDFVIVPSQSLGNFVTGTMNFSAHKARQLMWLGYWDTLKIIQNKVDSRKAREGRDQPVGWPWQKRSSGSNVQKVDDLARISQDAAEGRASAQEELGRRYALGQGVVKDDGEAFKWFMKSALQGFGSGELSVAISYLMGRGVGQDAAEALKWLRRAAEHGESSAQSTLGLLYSQGQLVPLDYSEASKWLRKATDQRNAVGMAGLGQLYAIGAGVPTDVVEAYKLYLLAVAQMQSVAKGEAQVKTMLNMGVADVRCTRRSKNRPRDAALAT